MLHSVALVRKDVLEERIASIIRVTIIGGLGATLAAISNRSKLHRVFLRSELRLLIPVNVAPTSLILVTLMMDAIRSSEMLVLTSATWRHS
jgi:hypothetical protein